MDKYKQTAVPTPAPIMQFLTALLVCSLTVLGVTSGEVSGRDYERRARKNLMAGERCKAKTAVLDGWSPLPCKASSSQCSLALQRIVKQPQSCAQSYMAGVARNVYLPIYQWFSEAVSVVDTATQFALNTGVSVVVYDPFGNQEANIAADGTENSLVDPTNLSYQLARTWALNYPSFVRVEAVNTAFIAQNVWDSDGRLLTVVIGKALNLLPVVC